MQIKPEEQKEIYSVVMEPSLYATIRETARNGGMSFSEYMRQAARAAMGGALEVRRENTKKQPRVKKGRAAALSLNDNN